MKPWREIYDGGSVEAEELRFQEYARRMVAVQTAHTRSSGSAVTHRTLHAKTVAGATGAELVFADDLPAELHVGAFRAGARLTATVRLSNAAGVARPDTAADLRGAALKIALPGGGEHDLLATSYPVSHVRNAAQFVTVAAIGAGPRVLAVPRMLAAFGPAETLRILGNLRRAGRRCESLALESYWSRGAILWGDAGPVRFRLSPLDPPAPAAPVPADAPDRLTRDFEARLARGPVRFSLDVQRFVSEEATPIEDGAVEWTGPWTPVATLTIPALSASAGDHVDGLAFSPWHAPAEFRPLGNLNRARRAVYAASAKGRQKH
ncbi:catalase [Catenuloplanes japonicus]|uniref:catalase n=1 Tax=Catenuloplanes japonicus TaxID=33876 RepID=UPI0005250140|nr:catalase [Catenuloplanes japonicus]